MLEDLPEFVYNTLIDQHLCDLDVKALRLVSKQCKSLIDINITALTPRDFPKNEVCSTTCRIRACVQMIGICMLGSTFMAG